jgi:hypothetical protein
MSLEDGYFPVQNAFQRNIHLTLLLYKLMFLNSISKLFFKQVRINIHLAQYSNRCYKNVSYSYGKRIIHYENTACHCWLRFIRAVD